MTERAKFVSSRYKVASESCDPSLLEVMTERAYFVSSRYKKTSAGWRLFLVVLNTYEHVTAPAATSAEVLATKPLLSTHQFAVVGFDASGAAIAQPVALL